MPEVTEEQMAAWRERMEHRRANEQEREQADKAKMIADAAIHQAQHPEGVGVMVPQRFATHAKQLPRPGPRAVQSGGRR